MADKSLWPLVVKALDTDSVEQAKNTLNAGLTQAGDNAPAMAARLALHMKDLETKTGKVTGLQVLTPYGPNVPESIDLALDLSHDDDVAVRQTAASFLSRVVKNPKAEARIIELVSDSEGNVRNQALSAIQQMDLTKDIEGSAASLYVIQDDDQRQGAIQLLDELEMAVNVIQDLGLSEGQNEIIQELIHPKINELRNLFGAASNNIDQVIEERKSSMIGLSSVLGSAKALALTISALANAEEAGQTLEEAGQALIDKVEALHPLLKLFAGWVS